MKKILCFALCLVLLFTTGVVGLAEETACEITYENSLLVCASTEEEVLFTPADFPGVDATRVLILYKDHVTNGQYYSMLIVVLNQGGEQARKNATVQLKQLPFITSVEENIYAEFQLTVDESPIVLRKGESYSFEYSADGWAKIFMNHGYLTFDVDPSVLDDSAFTKDTFSYLGLTDYWAAESDADWSSKKGEFPSLYHRYCSRLFFGSQGNGFEVADALARTPGIILLNYAPAEQGGASVGFEVTNTPMDVFSFTDENGGQIINVTANNSGQGTISFLLEHKEIASRQVIVYEPGDVTGDAKIDAKDALGVLKYAVQKVTLEPWQTYAAEVTGDTQIDAKDALQILKYSVGKINRFPVEDMVTPTDI